jgi:membrane-bound lytic murein transglycosylase MltF
MSNTEDKNKRVSWKDIEKHLALLIVGSLFAALVSGFGFYYKTSHNIEATQKDIISLKETAKANAEKINEISIAPVRIEEQVKGIQMSINTLTEQQRELVLRQDRVMEMLVQMNRGRSTTAIIVPANNLETAQR